MWEWAVTEGTRWPRAGAAVVCIFWLAGGTGMASEAGGPLVEAQDRQRLESLAGGLEHHARW